MDVRTRQSAAGQEKRDKKSSTTERLHECQVCGKAFKNKCNFQSHMKHVHVVTEVTEVYAKSQVRDVSVGNMVDFDDPETALSHSPNEKGFDGVLHGRNLTTVTVLENNQRACQDQPPLGCDFRGKRFKYRQKLADHINAVHEKMVRFECDVGGKKCHDKHNTKHAQHRHDTEKQWRVQCDLCQKYFNSKDILKRHIRIIHEKRDRVECPICLKTMLKQCLERHTRSVHLKERPFNCKICGQSFTMQFGANRHTRMVHENVRPHKCNVCSGSFHDRTSLRIHQRIHTRERPYSCDLCPFASARRGTLIDHLRAVHEA